MNVDPGVDPEIQAAQASMEELNQLLMEFEKLKVTGGPERRGPGRPDEAPDGERGRQVETQSGDRGMGSETSPADRRVDAEPEGDPRRPEGGKERLPGRWSERLRQSMRSLQDGARSATEATRREVQDAVREVRQIAVEAGAADLFDDLVKGQKPGADLDARIVRLREKLQGLAGPLADYALSGKGTDEPGADPPRVEVAYVLFMDLVGFSLLTTEEQTRRFASLQQLLRGTAEFRHGKAAGEMLRLSRGDGIALVFFRDAAAPVRCAIEIGQGIRSTPDLQLRMGIHSGPVQRVVDINARPDVTGSGINLAQRTMDCGDAGHILLSAPMAEIVKQLDGWSAGLDDLGECEVKHGVRLHLYNLYSADAGNPERPRRLPRLALPSGQASSPGAGNPRRAATYRNRRTARRLR